MHKILSVPSKSLFPQSCISSDGSMVGLMVTSSKRAYCHTQVCCTHSLCPYSRPLLIHTFSGDIQTQFWLSFCGVSGSWCAQGLFEPSEHLCRVRSLILNAILPLLPSCWGFSFALGHGVSFLVGANILQLMVVQQRVVVLEFSQEKMSACPSTLPSSRDVSQLLAMAELVLDGVWGLQKPFL